MQTKTVAKLAGSPKTTVPRLLYRGQLHEGQHAVNALLNKEGNGISPMCEAEVQQLTALRKEDPELRDLSDERILQLFSVTRTEELASLADSAKRKLSMPLEEICLETFGSSELKGHPGKYPKIYRITEESAVSFNTDSLARLHVNHRTSDGQEVEEFMKVLSGVQEWFFLIEGDVGLLSLPAEWQITYRGKSEHGGFMNRDTRALTLSQIVGPSEWEMVYTGTPNPLLDEIQKSMDGLPATLNALTAPARSASVSSSLASPEYSMGGAWQQALQKGLSKWCSVVGPVQRMRGVDVLRLRPSCPLLLLSGCTPGQFYHSHPHVPAEFDHLNFEMESQVFANIETIRKIGDAVQDHCDEIPFNIASMDWRKKPQVLQWVSNNGNGFAANAKVCGEATAQALAVHGMEDADMLGTFEVGDNVSDRRFLLETFAMFGLEGHSLGPERKSIRIDLKDEFDAQFFMPYVPGYLIAGEADLAVFSLTAASGEESVPRDGSQQVELLLEKLLEVLADLGASFEDVTLTWNRVADLSADEEAVLMTRSKKGLHRPLAESVLGLAGSDSLPEAPDGTPLAIEYIVVAQVPKRG